VANGVVSRTWIWGPEANTEGLFEPYLEGHNSGRFVQYFDKSRMEITTDQTIPSDSPWFVTNGLLATELITGRLQLGDDTFAAHEPAEINVAGDLDDTNVPTYAALKDLLDDAPLAIGAPVNQRVNRNGAVTVDPALAARGVTAATLVAETQHTVASVFWEFMNSSGTVWEDDAYVTEQLFLNQFYATGFPTTEAYWTIVEVGGVAQEVLVQAFERRVLTYTPGNPTGWKVEFGNIGQHYYHWRYVQIPADPTPTPTSTTTVTETATTTVTEAPTETPSETATATTIGTATATATITSTPFQPTSGFMMIETISPAPLGDQDASEEYVIIRNMQQSGDIQMRNWTLRDLDGNVFTFPDVTVKAGFYITVYMCTGSNVIQPRYAYVYAGFCHAFYDPPDEVSLYDSYGQHIDSYP
jgi:hypothetical protein